MKIALSSVMVDDQDRALAFYTGRLRLVTKHDIPMGEFRWLTVVSPEAPDGVELVLEPNAHPAARAFQQAMFADGIPVATFAVADLQAEFERLRREGVVFRKAPTVMGPVTIAVLDDTCGNFVQLLQGG
jgi:catechol 2,3-dioxygenase-like lactoylglutathione lyase family enzyme